MLDAVHKSPREILKFVETVLLKLVPATNYIVMDVKYQVISYFGRIPDLKWKGKDVTLYFLYLYIFSELFGRDFSIAFITHCVINLIYSRPH